MKVCPIHQRPVENVKEKNYFFRLSKYKQQLLDWYDRDPSPVQPTSRRNEVRAFVAGELRDLSVSRLRVGEVGHPGARTIRASSIYVWIDALTNYLTVLGGPDAVARGDGQGRVLAGVAPPHRQGHPALSRRLLAGDVVERRAAAAQAGLLPRLPDREGAEDLEVAPGDARSTRTRSPASWASIRCATSCCASTRFGGDGDFTYEALFQRYESDLGNDLGNLLNRTVSMVHKFIGAKLPAHAAGRTPTADASCWRRRRRRGRGSTRRARWKRRGDWCARTTRRSTRPSPGCCTSPESSTSWPTSWPDAARRCAGRR